jgi:hypothetical protein
MGGCDTSKSFPDPVPLGVSGSVTVPLSQYIARAGKGPHPSVVLLDEDQRIAYLGHRLWEALDRPLTSPGSEGVARSVLSHFQSVDVASAFANKAMQTLRDGESHNTIAVSADEVRVAALFVAWNGSHREMQSQRFGNYLSPLFTTMRRLVDRGIPLGGCLEIDAYVRENADTDDPGRPVDVVFEVDVEYSCLPGFAVGSANKGDPSLPKLIMLNPDLCTPEENQLLRKLMARSS